MSKAILIVKKGNPFLTDESPTNLAHYNALRVLVQGQNFVKVIVDTRSVEIFMGYKRVEKVYPKGATLKWLYDYIAGFWESYNRKCEYKRVQQPVAKFLKLARQQIERGGTFDFTDETQTCVKITCGTFTAQMWDLQRVHYDWPLVWRDIVEVIKESRETQRLKRLCETNGIEV